MDFACSSSPVEAVAEEWMGSRDCEGSRKPDWPMHLSGLVLLQGVEPRQGTAAMLSWMGAHLSQQTEFYATLVPIGTEVYPLVL